MIYQFLIDDPDPERKERRREVIDRALGDGGTTSQAQRERDALSRVLKAPRG